MAPVYTSRVIAAVVGGNEFDQAFHTLFKLFYTPGPGISDFYCMAALQE